MEIPTFDPVTSLRFAVTIDGDDLGTFTGVQGLSAQIDMHEYAEGGENGFTYKIPGRMSFTPIVCTRAIEGTRGSLAGWFTDFRKNKGGGKTGAITAYDGMGVQVTQWSLVDVYPSKWTGPQFGIDGPAVAHETLELTHNGFTQSAGPVPFID